MEKDIRIENFSVVSNWKVIASFCNVKTCFSLLFVCKNSNDTVMNYLDWMKSNEFTDEYIYSCFRNDNKFVMNLFKNELFLATLKQKRGKTFQIILDFVLEILVQKQVPSECWIKHFIDLGANPNSRMLNDDYFYNNRDDGFFCFKTSYSIPIFIYLFNNFNLYDKYYTEMINFTGGIAENRRYDDISCDDRFAYSNESVYLKFSVDDNEYIGEICSDLLGDFSPINYDIIKRHLFSLINKNRTEKKYDENKIIKKKLINFFRKIHHENFINIENIMMHFFATGKCDENWKLSFQRHLRYAHPYFEEYTAARFLKNFNSTKLNNLIKSMK